MGAQDILVQLHVLKRGQLEKMNWLCLLEGKVGESLNKSCDLKDLSMGRSKVISNTLS